MKLQDLKLKKADDLLKLAEDAGVENASTMLKQEMIFGILKMQAEKGEAILGEGVIEVLQGREPHSFLNRAALES